MNLSSSPLDCTTFHGGNARLGWNPRETVLTPARLRAGGFGKRWEAPLDGKVNGSPLFVAGLPVRGRVRDVVFAVTERNSAFAVDAADGAVLWSSKNLIPTLTDAEFTGNRHSRERVGNLSTPVIDRATETLYLCAPRPNGLRQAFEVWALDLRTGRPRSGWPALLEVRDRGNRFAAGEVMQRGALALVGGWLYIPFGGRGDIPPWRGWLVGVDTRQPSRQRGFCFSPVSDGAGVWSAGGVSATASGEIFAVTGNGDFDLPRGGANLSQSVIRLRHTPAALSFANRPTDIYTPANFKELDEQDEDLGGATALVLPDLPGASTPRLLFTGGKDGCAYLLSRDRLGGVGGELQKERLFGVPDAPYHEGIRATAAYFDAGPAGRLLFVPGDNPGPRCHGLAALRLSAGGPGRTARFDVAWTLQENLVRPTSPVVSSDGARGGVVWLVEPVEDWGGQPDTSRLRAFDALTGEDLFRSDRSPADRLRSGRKFTSVTVARGRVFVGAAGLFCYGAKERAR